MSKEKTQLLSPLFLKYQADYEKNPRSRVFAPLAETYRKLGMTDKAMEILSQGIRFHPTYTMGYLGLAFCYFDLRQYSLAYNTLRPLVETNRDNIRLQKLFADICLELGYREESLETFKYLLFINPRNKEVAMQVATLENLIEEHYKPVHQPIYIPESELKGERKQDSYQLFDIDKLENKPLASKVDFDDWMALDLSRDQKDVKIEDSYELWNLKKGDTPVNLSEKTTEDIHISFEVDLSNEENEEEAECEENSRDLESSSSGPALITHTLVDLYCGQGHVEKALEVLERILILNPNDTKTINKIIEIKALMGPTEADEKKDEVFPLEKVKNAERVIPKAKLYLEPLKDISEEDGRNNLMSILDKQLGSSNEPLMKEIAKGISADKKVPQVMPVKESLKLLVVEEKLTEFLKKIQKRALDYQARF